MHGVHMLLCMGCYAAQLLTSANAHAGQLSDAAWLEPSWLRPRDLVVAAGAKCGGTWMLYCTHQIRTKGSEHLPFQDVSLATPWPDMMQAPGATWEQQRVGRPACLRASP